MESESNIDSNWKIKRILRKLCSCVRQSEKLQEFRSYRSYRIKKPEASGQACCCERAYLSQEFSQPTSPGRLLDKSGRQFVARYQFQDDIIKT
jgi:hypothetical protein